MNSTLEITEIVEPAYYEGQELHALEQAQNYYGWLTHEFGPALHGRILEVGAGTGTLSQILLRGSCESLVCLEPAANLIPKLRSRLDSEPHAAVEIVTSSFEAYCRNAADAGVDSIVCLNVLEHIADDFNALREMQRLLRPGGHLCLFVPALPFIYGTLDATFGHHRRYTKSQLKVLAHEAGFTVKKLKYFNLPGSLAWFLLGKVLRWKTWDESPVKWYDKRVIPMVRFVESVVPPPFGQSLLLIAAV